MCQLSVVAYTRNPSTWEKEGKGPRILQETWSQSIINPSINPYLLSMLKNKHQMLGMAVCIYNSSYSRYWNRKIIKFKASVCNIARDILSHNKNFKKEWRTRRMTQQARVCTATFKPTFRWFTFNSRESNNSGLCRHLCSHVHAHHTIRIKKWK